MKPRPHRYAYYLPEAAAILGVPLRTIRYWIYHPLYRDCLFHITARNGQHPRRLRLLTQQDLDTLAHLFLLRSRRLLRPKLQISLTPVKPKPPRRSHPPA